ncbi:MAG: type I restriction endonuclease subunit R [Synechococcus sp.]|nr:type I restriction endonuclease subunit R [Synechococcus sp.]
MQTVAVTQAITTIAEAEDRFALRRVVTADFFREWQDNLPDISEGDRQSLAVIWNRYLYHRSGGHLLENTVMLLLISPLLTVVGLYDPPFRVRAEESVIIEAADSEEQLQGRLDLLVLCDRLWVIVLESKKTMLSVWSGLPQTLAYLMANPNQEKPCFAMLTNGDDIVFIKLENQQYQLSKVFSPLVSQSELEIVWQVLKNISFI